MRCGLCSMLLASACAAGGKVAEKNRFCRWRGSSTIMRPSSSPKPRSSNLSASSSTSVLTWPMLTALLSIKSSNRPGVATTMSAPPRRCSICGLIDTPPNTTATFTRCGKNLAKLLIAKPTCTASSRVGTTIRLCVRRGAVGALSQMCCSMGNENAAVLPDPVWAEASTSRPCKMAGMACTWMGVGVLKPSPSSARCKAGNTAGEKPRLEKGMGKTGVKSAIKQLQVLAQASKIGLVYALGHAGQP